MKIIFSSIIFAVSLLLISCVSPAVSNNSNTDSTSSIPSNSTPEMPTPLLESPTPLLEEQTQTEVENSEDSTSSEEPTTGKEIADAITKQFPKPTPVVILPTRDGNLDESEESEAVTEDAAVRLRRSGYIVQTAREANVASAISKIFGRSKAIGKPSIGRLGGALGIGAIILVGLATAQENEKSVTTSIYVNSRGVFEEISSPSWKTKNTAFPQRTSQCTENLLVNGDFEKDWAEGWNRTYADLEQGSSVTEVVNKNGNVLHMQHKGLAGVTLHQTVPVPRDAYFLHLKRNSSGGKDR